MVVKARSDYGTDKVKAAARQRTVIKMYRAATGLPSLPPSLDYWGLSGPMYVKDDATLLQPKCELRHFIEEGLLVASQYNGVEVDHKHHCGNLLAVENAFPGQVRLHLGDIGDTMVRACGSGQSRPGLVNLDLQWEPARAAHLLGRTLNTINDARVRHPVVIVWNVILKNPRKLTTYPWGYVASALKTNDMVQSSLTGWSQVERRAFKYWRKDMLTVMGTVVFVREAS
jgi:hypothetical protein